MADNRYIGKRSAGLTADDYPGVNCWSSNNVSGLLNYNAICRTTTAGTHGDVIMFNQGQFPAMTAGTNTAYGPYVTIPTYGTGSKPAVWLNLLKNGSTGSCSLTRDDYGLHWEHQVVIRFPQRSGEFQQLISTISNGAFTFILANADGGTMKTDTTTSKHYYQTFDIYGAYGGLLLDDVQLTTDLTNTHVAELTFKNIEEIGWEPGPPIVLFDNNATEATAYTNVKSTILSYVTMSSPSPEVEEQIDAWTKEQ